MINSIAEVEFPAITICPNFDIAYKSNILQVYNSSAMDIRNLKFPGTKHENMTSLDFFQKVTHSLTDILSKLSIRLKTKIDNKYNLFTLYDSSYHNYLKNDSNQMYIPISDGHWIIQNYLPFGRCFTFHVPRWLKLLQVCYNFVLLRLAKRCSLYPLAFIV